MAKDQKLEKVKVWDRGQITIPTKIRNRYGIGENTILTIKPLRGGIFLQPEFSIEEIQRRISAERKRRGITIKEMLDQLDKDEE